MDQSSTAPATTESTWTIRLNAINRAQLDWANSYEWEASKKVFNGIISTSTGNASVAMPRDFRKLDGFPRIVSDGTNTYDFVVDDPSNNRRYNDSDKYANLLGNPADGYTLYVSANTLASGASISFTYYSFPATLATTTSVTPVPDPTYVVQRALYYLYKANEDGRFPEAKVEADRILARMLEYENVLGISNVGRKVPVGDQKNYSFRIGRD